MTNTSSGLITPEIYKAFKTAIEIGKWPDGRLLTDTQKETCMSAIISYEHTNISDKERVGFIDKGHKAKDELCDDPQVLKFTKDGPK